MKTYILLSFLALFTLNCSYRQADKVSPLANEIPKGEKFRITLPEDHTTGYMWQIDNKFDGKVLDYYGSVFRGNEKGVDFNFVALEKGKTIVNFTLIKYRDTSEVKQFIIDVK
ncbi:MAG: protease inhibitor I42 family protein [Bacteroidota bacterium]